MWFGLVRFGSLSPVASRAALRSIGAMIDGENVTVTGYMSQPASLPAWPEELLPVWVLECLLRLSVRCCMLHGAVVSVPDVEP